MKNYLLKSALLLIVFFNFLVLLLISYYKHNNNSIFTQSDILLAFYLYQLIYLVIYKNFILVYKKILSINIIFIPIIIISSMVSLFINGFKLKSINSQGFILFSILITIIISLITNNINIRGILNKSFFIEFFKISKLNKKTFIIEFIIYFIILLCLAVLFNI